MNIHMHRRIGSIMTVWLVVIILAALASMHVCAKAPTSPGESLTLVDDGKSAYVIVIGKDATPSERFAAEELSSHVEQMSGVKLPILADADALPPRAILLGQNRHMTENLLGVVVDWKELGKEGCLLKTSGNRLIIAGGRPRGTLYGVYTLLEKYWGCRWFAPDTTLVPRNTTLRLPELDFIYRPAFEYREPWIYSGGARSKWWAKHFSPEYLPRTRNSTNMQKLHTFWAVDKPITNFDRYGGYFEVFDFSHNHPHLVPPENYSKEHPEYYSLRQGKRVTQGDIELCMSNPDVARIAAETLATWMRENPDADMFFIGQSDTDQYCQCEPCSTIRRKYGGWDGGRRREIPASLGEEGWIKWGGFAGLHVEFVNRIATRLETEFPNVRIGTFVYTGTQRPPRNITAHRNVVVWYCPTGGDPPLKRCFCHPIDRGPLNDDFCNFASEITAWSRIARQIYVFDYSQLSGMRQPADLLALRENVRAYRRLGVEGILVDAIHDIQTGFGFMRYWCLAQLLNDPDFDFERGMDEFATAYYGAAAPCILEYIDLACRPGSYEELSRDVVKPWTSDPYKPIAYERLRDCVLSYEWGGRVFTAEAIERGYQLFEKAMAAVSNDPRSLRHVLAARMCLQYTMLEVLAKEDRRLKREAVSLLALLKKLEVPRVEGLTLDDYRAKLSDKLGVKFSAP